MEPTPLAQALQWVARITSVALMMVLPGLAGWWLDAQLGTSFLVAVGFGLGFAVGLLSLLGLSGGLGGGGGKSDQPGAGDSSGNAGGLDRPVECDDEGDSDRNGGSGK